MLEWVLVNQPFNFLHVTVCSVFELLKNQTQSMENNYLIVHTLSVQSANEIKVLALIDDTPFKKVILFDTDKKQAEKKAKKIKNKIIISTNLPIHESALRLYSEITTFQPHHLGIFKIGWLLKKLQLIHYKDNYTTEELQYLNSLKNYESGKKLMDTFPKSISTHKRILVRIADKMCVSHSVTAVLNQAYATGLLKPKEPTDAKYFEGFSIY